METNTTKHIDRFEETKTSSCLVTPSDQVQMKHIDPIIIKAGKSSQRPLSKNWAAAYGPSDSIDKKISIKQHYFIHMVDVIKDIGSLQKINCCCIEQRIHKLKYRINSTARPEKNTVDVYVNEDHDSDNTQGLGNDNINSMVIIA